MRGRVKWYSAELGHGFIIPEDGSADIFMKAGDVAGGESEPLANDDQVFYEAVEGDEGMEAKNVFRV